MKTVYNAVTHPVQTFKNAAKSIGNAAKAIYKEVKTPAFQSKFASPTKGTNSGSSYSGSFGGGAYTTSPMAYDSNGNVYSYFNTSFDTGKIPSTDAPRIKDVDEETLQFCASGLRNPKTTYRNNPWELLDYPGEIHNAVEMHLSAKYGLVREHPTYDHKYRIDL